MNENIIILLAEDDRGHFVLTRNYLRKAGIDNDIVWFKDGQQTLDFFCNKNTQYQLKPEQRYILLLDIRMPKIWGYRYKRNTRTLRRLSGRLDRAAKHKRLDH